MRNLVFISLCLILSACGVKPGQVSAPEASSDSQFPQSYPDTRTDPLPTQMRAP